MCGLAGIYTNRTLPADVLAAAVEDMAGSLVHRGPDDAGTWTHPDARLAFGFRRLAIQDLSDHGHQPMVSASGRFTIVFNGEVYNHLELRPELQAAGARFRGHSDTETILACFEKWGIQESLPRFIGMFAMAVWDERDRSLTLVRDRLGIKPLFIYQRGGHVMFGSELRAIMNGPGFAAELDETAVDAYLRYLYVPAPSSIFKYVSKLLPGHTVTFRSPDDSVQDQTPYWSLRDIVAEAVSGSVPVPDEEAADQLEALLSDAVRLRLLSDVPVGSLLSGGIDSSLVTALAQRHSSRPMQTYSIGFDVEEYNEAPAAAAVARHLGTDHTEVVVEGQDMLSLVPRLPELFDEPLANASQLPTYVVCETARRDVTVALAGDGGDEVFGGYHRYIQGAQLINRLTRIPRVARTVVGASAARVPAGSWDRAYRGVAPILPDRFRHRLAGDKVAKMAGLMQQRSAADMYDYLLATTAAPPSPSNGIVHSVFERASQNSLMDRMMLADQLSYLPDDLLAKVDRASMAVSLEVRVPILDHRVVELGWRLAARQKVRGNLGKWALRQVLERHVPRALTDRPKMGFTVPVADWLRGPLRPWAEDLLFAGHASRNGAASRAATLWHQLQRGHTNTANALWAVLMLQAWRRRWRV